MTDSSAHWRAAEAAVIEWADGTAPRSSQFDDIYYSPQSGLEESRHVFLGGADVTSAWRDTTRFTVAETGFGTGLNFLATWNAWRQDPRASKLLHYIAIEKHPLRMADLQRALSVWQPLADLAEQLQAMYPAPLPGRHRLLFDGGNVILDLHYEDASSALTDLLDEAGLQVDCWYMDGFAPARNADMWTTELYQRMAQLSRAGSRLATFTAAGHVRRGLQDAGFAMEKTRGFGSKRDMLRGCYQGASRPRPLLHTPWHLAASTRPRENTAIVLGAGLAGASVAHALAGRGWQVDVFERGQVAGAASGNLQGILYTRISHRPSSLNAFSLHSFNFALRHYRHMMHTGLLEEGRDGEFCGSLQLLENWQEQGQLRDTVNSLPELVRYLPGPQAEAVSGIPDCPGGLFYPGSGWLQPASVCAALLRNPMIGVHQQCGPLSLRQQGDGWLVLDSAGNVLHRAAIAVVAAGTDSGTLPALSWLPVQAIRGQVTHIPSGGVLQELRTVICHEGYIAPAAQGVHCLGATFDLSDGNAEPSPASHAQNISRLGKALAAVELPSLAAGELAGRVGFRCASPDYLPIAGPVPDYDHFLVDYAPLRKNARKVIDRRGTYLSGLFVSTGHGSRGLTSTPLSAELLAAQINGEPLPVSSQLHRALAPARFIVRDLIRNRL